MITPPGFTILVASMSKSRLMEAMLVISSGFNRQRISGWRRSVPTPEHGASSSTASKLASGSFCERVRASAVRGSTVSMPYAAQRSPRILPLNSWSSTEVIDTQWPNARCAALWSRMVFVPRPEPISRKLAGSSAGMANCATVCAPSSDTSSSPASNSARTSALRSERASFTR